MSRSQKKLRADLERVNLHNKTVKQQAQTITQQYIKNGYKLPKKLENGNVGQKDINRYYLTLKNRLDKRVEREEIKKSSKGFNNDLLKQFNELQKERNKAVRNLLPGYSEEFIQGFTSGKLARVGRGQTVGLDYHTKEMTKQQVLINAKFNKTNPNKYLKQSIEANKKSLQELKNGSYIDTEYLLNEVINSMELEGYSLTETQKNKIKQKIARLDWLGQQKAVDIIHRKIENSFYKIYNLSEDMGDSNNLTESILNDLEKASRSRLITHASIIGG